MAGYTLADGITLKNKLGATSRKDLEALEEGYVAARLVELRLGLGPTSASNASDLRAIHYHLFQDVFEWAGHTRDEHFLMADGEIATMPIMRRDDGADFTIGPLIPVELDAVMNLLNYNDRIGDLSRNEFSDLIADCFARINSIHAFREGNGRTQRAFFETLAAASGHDISFGVVSRERMSVVSVAAHENADPAPLRRLFREIVDPMRVKALRSAQTILDKYEFDWRGCYISTTEEGRQYTLTMSGTLGPDFIARDRDHGIIVGRLSDLPGPTPKRGEQFDITTAVGPADISVNDENETEKTSEGRSPTPKGPSGK